MMINLQLLGGLDVAGPGLPADSRARRRHPLMVLALVAAAAPQPVSRERLMAFLWPESDAARASNSLRQTLHSLRRDLGEDVFLPETPCGIQLDSDKVAVDLWTFREAIERKRPADAVASYRGPFLGGFQMPRAAEFARWAETEGAAVQRELVAALDSLAREAEDAGSYDDAVTRRQRQAESDPYSSRAALGLLKALTAAGDRPGALAYAVAYEDFLRAHLEVAPDPAVTEFVATLRRATPPGPLPIPKEALDLPGRVALRPTVSLPAINAPDRRPAAARGWMFAVGLSAIALVGVGSAYTKAMPVAVDPVIVLGSGASDAAGRDTANRLVSCAGPACPAGSLPQPAFIIPKHAAYADAAPGTRFISPVADGATIRDPGYECCTTAVFERAFTLPSDATSATLTVTIAADNQAFMGINGTEFGRQPERDLQWNFAGAPMTFTRTFVPDPSGINRLRVTLWDGGGVTGLNYRAFVRYERQK